jgi:glyoxylase-like metal-dependent hydrolase (beta-lactamase superfamily II)
VNIHHLSCACIRGLSNRGRPLSCHVLLIETPASGLVLVDTGLGTADYEDPPSRLGREFVNLYARPKREPTLAAIAQIRALGFRQQDVRHILLTHMDLDHIGGLSDFPQAAVHLHKLELSAAVARRGFKARRRYRPPMWAHGPDFRAYSEEGERWFGFEAVRGLQGLPPEILLIPLFGHTLGHCGVAVQSTDGWLLHAGDAYFDSREVNDRFRRCALQLALLQAIVTTNRAARLYNQDRLRALARVRPDVRIFCAHDPWEFEAASRRRR